jgi:pimeloyl-ACP methyl ester carboxylesterase
VRLTIFDVGVTFRPRGPHAPATGTLGRMGGDRTMELRGGRVLGWCEAGDPSGRALLWFHGGLSSAGEAEFLDAAARAHGIRLLAPDRPGVGESSPWDLVDVAQWSAVVDEWSQELGLDRFSVAGWSAGGPYALACARWLADRLDAVTLVASMYPVTDPARLRGLGLRTDRVLLPLAQRHPGRARVVLEPSRWLPPAALWRLTRASAAAAERAALTPEVRPAFTAMLRRAVRHGVGGVVADYRCVGGAWGFALADVTTPVTLLQGSADGMVPPAHAELLRAQLGAASLRVLPGAGHFLPLTHAEEIVASLGA